MYTLADKLRIVRAWLLSFVLAEWRPEHYPVRVREQLDVPADSRWCAQVLNWPSATGLGPTKEGALDALGAYLRAQGARRIAEGGGMPRPGASVPVEFASTTRVNADPDLLEAFITKALGFEVGDPVFISDESSIDHFGDEERVVEILKNIREHFGVTLEESESLRIADVLERIRARHEA